MLLDCPACARSYHVSRAEIGAEGRTVVCPRCDASWFVQGDPAAPDDRALEDLRTTGVSRRPDTGASHRPVPRAKLRRHAAPALLAVAGLVAAMGLLGARERIVRMAPRLGGLYAAIGLPVNVRGLEIATLSPSRPADSPQDLTIAGEIRNVTQRRVGVPRLTYEIRDAAGAPLVTWSEHAPARTLGVGKTLPFVSAPHDLPAGAATVLVRFDDVDLPAPVRIAGHIASSLAH